MRISLAAGFLAAVVLLPAHAIAAVCFSIAGPSYVPSGPEPIISLEVQATTGSPTGGGSRSGQGTLFTVAGFWYRPGFCSFDSAPVAGTALLQENGTARIGLTVNTSDGSCATTFIEGVLDSPGFNQGSGFFEQPRFDQQGALTFTPAACPAFP